MQTLEFSDKGEKKSFTEKVQEMFILKHEATKNISPEFINDLYKNPELGLHTELEILSQKSGTVFIHFLNDSTLPK